MQVNQSKLNRQNKGINKWLANSCRGTWQWCTGMGKTYGSVLLIKQMLARDKNRTTIVVVPTKNLKAQWEEKTRKLPGVKVYVINTIVINQLKLRCNLLILDEIHRYGGEEEEEAARRFVKVFEYVQYDFILGLTATMKRLDGLHTILEKHAPVIDTITPEEAKKEEWIAEFYEYNLLLDMTPEEEEIYTKANGKFKYYFSKFAQDFDLAMKSQFDRNKAVNWAYRQGWKPAMGDDHPWSPKKVQFYSVMFNKSMQARKKLLYESPTKLAVAEELIRTHVVPTITFSESTTFADELTKRLGTLISCVYHSYIPTVIMLGLREIAQAVKIQKKEGGKMVSRTVYEDRKGKQHPTYQRIKAIYGAGVTRVGSERRKERELKRFTKGKVRVINTAKALDQGFDAENIQLVIITSYTQNPTQRIQRIGRGTRKFKFADGTDKTTVVVNLVLRGTPDERWIKKAQEGVQDVITITDINEIEFTKQELSMV